VKRVLAKDALFHCVHVGGEKCLLAVFEAATNAWEHIPVETA
jgi:hypothetical protein